MVITPSELSSYFMGQQTPLLFPVLLFSPCGYVKEGVNMGTLR